MKFIFDFDDVLLHTSKGLRSFREHIYSNLETIGVSPVLSKKYLERERWNQFSLKKMLAHFSVKEELYEKIMNQTSSFVNRELLELVKKIGKNDCYIITYGDEEFQKDKIERSGVSSLFSKIIAVSSSKKEAVEEICDKFKNEKIIFIDDKAKHFEDLDFIKCPNLKTILYDEQGLSKLTEEIKDLRNQY